MKQEPLTEKQKKLLASYVPRAFTFTASFHRRLGYVATDYAGTVARSKAAAKKDKYALKASRLHGITPTAAPDYSYRNAGLVDNLRRF